MTFALRPGRPSDHAFVTDTWLRANRHTGAARDMLRAGIYWSEYKQVVRELLAEHRLTVAHDAGDEDAILGWACTTDPPPLEADPCVYFVYTRARRCGIAKALLAEFLPHACDYKHMPSNARIPIPESWQYDPERT